MLFVLVLLSLIVIHRNYVLQFEDPRDADDAIYYRDGYDFDGYRLRVSCSCICYSSTSPSAFGITSYF